MKLILLRHGQSIWNLENRFTGWKNIGLTRKGKKEAKNAGLALKEIDIDISLVFVSMLKRAIDTCKICLKQLKGDKPEVVYDWRLNERHYGDLQGLNKSETAKKYGEEQVLIWRRSYDIPPPPLSNKDKRHPKYDKLYKDIEKNKLPNSESLKDTLNRVKPLWSKEIYSKLISDKNILIVAHGNSIRAIVKMLKKLSNEEILKLNIPTGVPYIFDFNRKLEIIDDYYIENDKS
tara:strand:+ start:70 stop:768 length:699 start_codon:yes stop_codon:yes gene_type:complete